MLFIFGMHIISLGGTIVHKMNMSPSDLDLGKWHFYTFSLQIASYSTYYNQALYLRVVHIAEAEMTPSEMAAILNRKNYIFSLFPNLS